MPFSIYRWLMELCYRGFITLVATTKVTMSHGELVTSVQMNTRAAEPHQPPAPEVPPAAQARVWRGNGKGPAPPAGVGGEGEHERRGSVLSSGFVCRGAVRPDTGLCFGGVCVSVRRTLAHGRCRRTGAAMTLHSAVVSGGKEARAWAGVEVGQCLIAGQVPAGLFLPGSGPLAEGTTALSFRVAPRTESRAAFRRGVCAGLVYL
jgi:hypothetical protein